MVFGFRAPKIGWVPHENIFKTLIYPFLTKMAPGGGFTRRRTNYLHTPLLEKYTKNTSLWTP